MPVNIPELERRARRLLTPEVYDYYAGGVGREQTRRANVRAWRQCWLLPRVLRDVSVVDTSARLPGSPETVAATPVAVAPTGFQRLAHPEGEVATARGAALACALRRRAAQRRGRAHRAGPRGARDVPPPPRAVGPRL